MQDCVVSVVKSEMSSSMQTGTIDCINLAFLHQGSNTNYVNLVIGIYQRMESKYGGKWCCIAGTTGYASHVHYKPGNYFVCDTEKNNRITVYQHFRLPDV